ncbi:MAG: caspase family protein, partial [Saprospiraceae bacterium]|nr:caspase family protein [Saprospiraceae bacterium]
MFRLILVLLLCLPYLAIGQNEKPASSISTSKSIKPLPQSTNHQSTNHQTRAVVIGISDYQDPAIPDLRFADRDAEAFADWLRSPAGGSLPESSIHLLLDKDATTGKIIAALDGLISASKPGDVAILYFSGHGDVERVTKFQRGYFLTWDSPPAVYAAGAFSLVFLQDIISTLSETGVQVVVVSDACRAGKLAGSEFGGAQATSAAMAKQFANEIKILSCQPDEFSLEGEQWGGGRGAFSYHLVDGLYGLADGNSDGTVSLLELGRYLEDKVPGETAPHSQIPFTVGSKAARVASVDAEMLTSWREKKKGETQTFVKTDGKGLEDLALAKADSSIQEMYVAFTAAIERGELMPTDSTAGRSANDYYELLIKEPALADLHGLMTRNFAAALMDEGQQHLNLFLKTDPQLLDDIYNGRVNYQRIADYIQRSAELLGPKHYVYS